MLSTLAQTAPVTADSSTIAIGVVVIGLSSVLQLALAAKQLIGGNKGERQIEPTQLAGIAAELKTQTTTLNKLDREVGEVKTKVELVEKNVDGFHQRVGGISRDLAATVARVDGLEKRETHKR